MTKRKQIDFLLDLNQEIREKYRSERANNRQLRRDIDEILEENEKLSDKCRAQYKELEEVRKLSAETAKERDELKNRADLLLKENEKLRRKDVFTFDKAEFQRLKLENAELRVKLEDLERKGAKK